MIVVNVGVNDTDKKSCQDVFENLENITSEIEGLAPNAKIIISELTPRNDKRDPEVQVCNARINLMKANNCHPNVTIACLKSAFRKAFGIYKSKPLSRDSKGNHHQQQFTNTKYTNNGSLKSFKTELLSKLTSMLNC